jgi:hypothetical protein
MSESPSQTFCELSFASLRNILLATKAISEFSNKMANLANINNSLPDQSIEDLLQIASAAEKSTYLLELLLSRGTLEESRESGASKVTSNPNQALRDVLLRISESAHLMTLLEMKIFDKTSRNELNDCRQNLSMYGTAVKDFMSGMICFETIGSADPNCKNRNCIIKSWGSGPSGSYTPRKGGDVIDIQTYF